MVEKRNDLHRPSTIIPAEYDFVLWYATATADAPSFGVNCILDNRYTDKKGIMHNGKHAEGGGCCLLAVRLVATFASTGGTGSCSVCGSFFVYGEVWKHTPSGEHIHVGHICADKYGLLRDRSAIELLKDRRSAAKAAALVAKATKARKAAFLEANPGLAEALDVNHTIIIDINHRFNSYNLSEKQVALVFKLAEEIRNPAPPELHVPAPEGRVTFTGKIVAVKSVDGYTYNSTVTKLVVKVETPEGSWLVWMTAPGAILGIGLKDRTITATATLTRGKDVHFAFGKRPSKVSLAPEVIA